FIEAVSQEGSSVWQFESAVEAIITGDVPTLNWRGVSLIHPASWQGYFWPFFLRATGQNSLVALRIRRVVRSYDECCEFCPVALAKGLRPLKSPVGGKALLPIANWQ